MANSLATLHSLDRFSGKFATMQLPLYLQAQDPAQLDLTHCPHVYENGHYDLNITLDLVEIENRLQSITQQREQEEVQAQSERFLRTASGRVITPTFSEQDKRRERLNLGRINTTSLEDNVSFDEDDPFADEDDALSALNNDGRSSGYSLKLRNGSFKHVVSVSMEINGQVKATFILRESAPHVISGQAVFSESSSSGNNNQPFLLQYDAIDLCFVIKFSDNHQLTLYSGLLLCANNNKEENQNINQILRELTEVENDNVLDLMFQNKKLVEKPFDEYGSHRAYKSLNSYVNLIADILSCYRNNFGAFKAMAKHVIVKDNTVLPFDKVRSVTHKSAYWLAQNLDVLMAVKPEAGSVEYNGKSYLPLKMQSEINKKSFDTFENRVVMGFIQTVLHNATKIYNDYKGVISSNKFDSDDALMLKQGQLVRVNVNQAVAQEQAHAAGYQAPIVALKDMQLNMTKTALEKLQDYIGELNNIYINYHKIFPINSIFLRHFPRKAKAFQEIKPYAQVFGAIMDWFRYGDFTLAKDQLFLNVKTLDKIYEYYCLYRLLDMLIDKGFQPDADNASYIFDYPLADKYAERDLFVANTYQLTRGKQKVTVYYQPVISNSRFDNGIYAYRTTKHASGTIATAPEFNFYCPDFVLKFSSGEGLAGDDDYLFFDAKFSQGRNIIAHYIDNLIQKYCIETSIAILRRPLSAAEREKQGLGAYKGDYYNSAGTIIGHADSLQAMSNGYEYVGSKAPKMIFALQGRVNTRKTLPTATQQTFVKSTAGGRQVYYKAGTQQPVASVHKSIWFYHNSPLARKFPPNTSVGMVEMNTQVDSTPDLWREITRNLPYLRTEE